MKKKAFIVLLSLAILLVVMVSCEENLEGETDNESIYEGEREMEEVVYVTAEEYMEFYGLTEENFVPIEYLEEYLQEWPMTYEMLKKGNDYLNVIGFYNEGHIFGYNILNLIDRECVFASEDEDFSTVKHIILWDNTAVTGTEYSQSNIVVIDIVNEKYYYNANKMDFTDAEVIKNINDEIIDELLSELRSIITPKWEQPESLNSYHHIRWNLYLVKEDGSVIYYWGYTPDEEGHPGFHDWFVKVQNLAEE